MEEKRIIAQTMRGYRVFSLRMDVKNASALLGVHPMTYRKWESCENVPNAAAYRSLELMALIADHHESAFEDLCRMNGVERTIQP